MQNNKLDGKRLLKKLRITKTSIRRGLSLLMCLSMAASMFGGVAAFAQEGRQAMPPQTDQREVSRVKDHTGNAQEDIKERLLQRIQEGWDPFSFNEDITMEEFYVLMGMFQDKNILPLILPVEDAPQVGKVPGSEEDANASPAEDPEEPDDEAEASSGVETADPEEPGDEAEAPGGAEAADPEESGNGEAGTPGEPGDGGSGESDDSEAAAPEETGDETEEPENGEVKAPAAETDDAGESEEYQVDETGTVTVYVPEGAETATVYVPEGDVPLSAGLDVLDEYIPRDMFTIENIPEEKQEPQFSAWPGLALTSTGGLETVIITDNSGDSKIAGDVNQDLFPKYDGYYVRRVTAQDNDIAVLGAINLFGNYVYYYTTSEDQNRQVSATTLPENGKFAICYEPSEFGIAYRVLLAEEDPPKDEELSAWLGGLKEASQYKMEDIFGTDYPTHTENGAYSFTAKAPDYHMLAFYVQEGDGELKKLLTWDGAGTRKEGGTFTDVNNGWALGMEPDYEKNVISDGYMILPNPNGPQELTTNGTIYNKEAVTAECVIFAVLKKKDVPIFNAGTIIEKSNGAAGRGAIAEDDKDKLNGHEYYDYEEEYLTRSGGGKSPYGENNNSIGNILPKDGEWNWQKHKNYRPKMKYQEEDGTYSFQWTFQTNNGDKGYTLDALMINQVPISIPFLPKYSERGGEDTSTNNDGNPGSWWMETTLPDGVVIKVEYLMIFNNNTRQRVYRITVTGARSNITITGLNLMMGDGAKEFSTYELIGVSGDDTDREDRVASIQFCDGTNWQTVRGSKVVINQNGYIDYNNGDQKHGGANLRFKVQEGYGSPYYLWEDYKNETVRGTDDVPQASIKRNPDGTVDRGTQNPVILMRTAGGRLESDHIYYDDGDGYYYMRVSSQPEDGNDPRKKFVLLTVVAQPVQYAVQYVTDEVGPNYDAGKNEEFEARSPVMPYDGELDNNLNKFYDEAVYRDVAVSSFTPKDEKGYYKFQGWVLLDENGNETDTIFSPSSSFDVRDYKAYGVRDNDLSTAERDVLVLTLKATWQRIDNPYHFSVRLRQVTAQGIVKDAEVPTEIQNDFDVLTDFEKKDDNSLAVKVLTGSEPFKKWFAQNPTYALWDDINNGTNIDGALREYFEEVHLKDPTVQADIRKAVTNMDADGNGAEDYSRQDNYSYAVYEDKGVIDIWMYETLGGLVFNTEVQGTPFAEDEEFPFTVKSKEGLNGRYAAYDEKLELKNATPEDIKWVTFENGKAIDFTLKDGEGVVLYVPRGQYTVIETGSRSQGAYKAVVDYVSENPIPKGWDFGQGEDKWLMKYNEDESEGLDKAVYATVEVDTGEHNVVRTIHFINQTGIMSFEPVIRAVGSKEYGKFGFIATLTLPDGVTPLKAADGEEYFYFNFNRYAVDYTGATPNTEAPSGERELTATGRMVLKQAADSTWESQYLLQYQNGTWTRIPEEDTEGIWLSAAERIEVVSVPGKDYSVLESDKQGLFLSGKNPREGTVPVDAVSYQLFINSNVPILPATGGAGVGTIWVMGTVFLLSGLGLMLLNRDHLKKRKRGVGV